MRKFLFSAAALALIASPTLAGKFNKKVSVGDKAPTFSGVPATTPNGEEASISLGDIKEDVVVIAFLANHCPVVVAYEDRVQEFADSLKGKNVKFIAVAVTGGGQRKTDDLAAIKERLKPDSDKKFNYTYGFDDSQQMGRDYGATNTPQFFVLDKDRTIRYMGAMDDNMNEAKASKTYVKDAVDALLSGKEIEVSETQPKGCGISYDRN